MSELQNMSEYLKLALVVKSILMFYPVSGGNCSLNIYICRTYHLPIGTGIFCVYKEKREFANCVKINNQVGDEFHFIMQCNALPKERKKSLKKYYDNPPTLKFASPLH